MLFSDKLKEWYGEDVEFNDLQMTTDVAIFLVETKNNIEIARVFHIDDRKEISIDLKVVKGDTFAMMRELASYFISKKIRSD